MIYDIKYIRTVDEVTRKETEAGKEVMVHECVYDYDRQYGGFAEGILD